MRTNISVEGHEVLALWSEGVSKLVSKNMSLVGNALRRSGWVRTGEKKPLLALEATKAGTQQRLVTGVALRLCQTAVVLYRSLRVLGYVASSLECE